MTATQEDLVTAFVHHAESTHGIDWEAVGQSVLRRLRAMPPLPNDVLDPWRYPSYWCAPLLVGDYVEADASAVAEDLEQYVAGCLVRHFHFDADQRFDLAPDDDLDTLVETAYDGCRDFNGTFEGRFAAKCQPWTVLLALGTGSIRAQTAAHAEYYAALGALVGVFSCVQILDDWHDQAEDRARGIWNMWGDEPTGRTLQAIEPLVRSAHAKASSLRKHLLRSALAAQLRDTTRELADLIAFLGEAADRPRPRRGQQSDLDEAVAAGVAFLGGQLGANVPGLWRDFALAGVSAGSTECVSAFISTQLASTDDGRSLARGVASTLLAHARSSGGWGYREDVPEDSDSTAWVLLASAEAGVTAPPGLLRRSQDFLVTHGRRDGGFATYLEGARTGLTSSVEPGWFASEAAVTCSTVLALAATGYDDEQLLRTACDFIARGLGETGWASYWWGGPTFGTWIATWALTAVGGGAHEREVGAAHDLILARRNPDAGWGSEGRESTAFDTALAISTLLIHDPSDARTVRESADTLARMQEPSGRWPPAARMLAPGAHAGDDLVLHDELMTTACAIAALNRVRIEALHS